MAEIDVTNRQAVGLTGKGRVICQTPTGSMSPLDAAVHGAWLIEMATMADPSIDIDAIRQAVAEEY